jgi:hypothetical protein
MGAIPIPAQTQVLHEPVVTRAQRAQWHFSWEQRLARHARPSTAPPLTRPLHGLPATFAHASRCALLDVAELPIGEASLFSLIDDMLAFRSLSLNTSLCIALFLFVLHSPQDDCSCSVPHPRCASRGIFSRGVSGERLSEPGRWEHRERTRSQMVMVSLLVSWHLLTQERPRSVCLRLSAGLRVLGLASIAHVPTRNAFVRRRTHLGVRFVRWLVRRVCQPLATAQTPGACACGSRLTAIDGTVEDVAASQENARVCGRTSQGHTASPSPQARGLSLGEVATHLIVDAISAPCTASEQRLCWGLVRRIIAGMRVLLDRGVIQGAFVEELAARHSQALARLWPRGSF